MLTMTATEAKTNFGQALMKCMQEPIKICKNKNKKPVAVLMSMDEWKFKQKIFEMIEDDLWGKLAKKNEREGYYLGTEESEKFLNDIKNS